MSGRVTWWRDGEKVTGYRKTARRNPRREREREREQVLPWWRLSFMLPAGISVKPDWDHHVVGVTIETVGDSQRVEILGKNNEWLISQAAALLRKLNWRGWVSVRLTRFSEPGPTLSGPLRRGEDGVIQLEINHQGFAVVKGTSLTHREYPGEQLELKSYKCNDR